MSNKDVKPIGVIGAGTMGRGIAQIAATYGHPVFLLDVSEEVLQSANEQLWKIYQRLVEKGKMVAEEAQAAHERIHFTHDLQQFAPCGMVVEAVAENLEVKKEIFTKVETVISRDAILASNTSSLSIAALSSACQLPERFLGIHFFNPAPIMPLVEIIPGVASDSAFVREARAQVDHWGKVTVLAKDTPGFIVNRVARPFYGEALRLLEEGVADVATIDWAMKEIGGFRMGPFELMDFIGNDINYAVTESVFAAFFYDPRFKPAFTQKRLCEAGFLGRKTGRGYYDYRENSELPEPSRDVVLGKEVVHRVVCMLINEAIDAVFMGIASPEDIELAMTRGVNYPRGLLKWADMLGLSRVLSTLQDLQDLYGEDRYRPNPLLKRMVRSGDRFFPEA